MICTLKAVLGEGRTPVLTRSWAQRTETQGKREEPVVPKEQQGNLPLTQRRGIREISTEL